MQSNYGGDYSVGTGGGVGAGLGGIGGACWRGTGEGGRAIYITSKSFFPPPSVRKIIFFPEFYGGQRAFIFFPPRGGDVIYIPGLANEKPTQ